MAGPIRISVLADASQASREFQQVSGDAGGMGKAFKTAAKVAAAALVVAGAAAVRFGISAVQAASDMNETLSKSRIIFGQHAAEVEKWAAGAAKSMGLSKAAALDAAAGFGDMFSQIGFTGDQATKMSKGVVRLSADLGSFNNLPTEDVAQRISSAFRGEYDSLQALVPTINAARVEQEALAKTGKESAKELTAQEKAAATLAIIYEDTARAQGDFARTSGGLANQQKILGAQFENLKTRIGKALLPVAVDLVTVLNKQLMPVLKDLANKFLPRVRTALQGIDFAAIASGSGGLSVSLDRIGASLRGVDTAGLGEAFGQGITDSVSVFSVVIGFAADHVDTLAKHLPLLITAFIAFKAAQAAANVVGLAHLPVQVANTAATFALAAANRSLARQMAISNGVEKVTILTRVRSAAATVASTVATKAASAAAKAWAAAQWLLNVALTANPIGLVVVAVAALAAAFVVAYKKSETFRAVVAQLMDFFAGIPAKIKAAFGSLRTLLVDAGKDLIQGLIDGITSMFGAVQGKLGDLTDSMTGWKGPPAKDRKLLKPTGAMIIQGLVDGMVGNTDEVKAVLTKLTDAISKYMGKRFESDKAAKRHTAAVLKATEDERKAILRKAKAYDQVLKKIEKAKDALKAAKQAALDYAASVQDAIVSTVDITALGRTRGTAPPTAATIIEEMRDKVAEAQHFATLIAQLAAQGLNQAAIDQMLAAGAEAGTATAEAIAAGGQAAIDEINTLTTRLDTVGAGLGTTLAGTFYQSGIDTAQAFLDGLLADEERIRKAAQRLARKLQKALRAALGLGGGGGTGGNARTLFDATITHEPLKQTISLHLTGDQLDQLQRGRKYSQDINAWYAVGGRYAS